MQKVGQQLQSAVQFHQSGDLERAEELYRRVLGRDAAQPDALHLLGLLNYQRGQLDQAVDHLTRAIAAAPARAAYYNSLALACMALGHTSEAEECLGHALRLEPRAAAFHANLGNLRRLQGRPADAVVHYQDAIRCDPNYVAAQSNLALAQKDLGQLEQAEATCRAALRTCDDLTECWNNLGTILSDQGRVDEAVECYSRASQIDPRLPAPLNNAARILADQGELQRARELYRRAIRLRPGKAYWQFREQLVSPVVFESTEQIDQYRHDLSELVRTYLEQPFELPLAEIQNSRLEPPFCLAYQGRDDRAIKERFAELFLKCLPSECRAARQPSPANGPLHVGFVVTSGHEPVFIRLLGGIVKRLNSRRFHISIVATTPGYERIRAALASDSIGHITLASDFPTTVNNIRRARCDVLFYLEVGTDSVNYFLPYFRLAPIQCTSWGTPVTSGIEAIDYFISSRSMEPPDGPSHYSEQLILLDTLPACLEWPEIPQTLKDRSYFGFDDNDRLYGCLQHLRKFHPDFDDALAEILQRDPRAKVVVLRGPYPTWDQQLRRRLERRLGPASERICFLPRQNRPDFLSLTAACDVLLDTFHYGGGMTTFDAVATATPLVTLPGSFMRSRVTLGCYTSMELTDLVATSPAHYVDLALRVAGDRDLHHDCAERIRAAAPVLFDNSSAALEIEAFFENIAERARGGDAVHAAGAT